MSRARTALVVLAGAALTLAGCGRGDSGGRPQDAGTVGAGPATGTVNIWAMGSEADKLPTLLKGFEQQNPGVHVKVTAIPWADAHDKFQTAIAAGTTPDIGQMGTTWMGEFGQAGVFAPTPADIDTGTFYSGSVASTKLAGGTFGIPWYVDTPVLYYRTDLAKKAGFTAPPKNAAELKALAKAMQQKAGAKYGISLPPKDFQAFLPFAWSNGARLTTADGAKWTLDTPEMAQALSFYQSFFDEGIADKTPSTDNGAQESAFVKGTVPMLINGAYEAGLLKEAGGDGFEKKFATAVIPGAKSNTSFVGGGDLVVFRKAKNPTAAWKLIQYLAKPATQVGLYKMTGDLPSVQAAWTDPSLTGDAKLAVFGQQLKSVQAPPNSPRWEQVNAAGGTQMERVTTNGLSPAAALKTLQSQADSIGTGD